MKYLSIGISIIFFFSCNSTKKYANGETLVKLNFEDCLLENKGFNILSVEVPKGYKLTDHNYHGFCEYRFIYSDSTFFYLSTDIYSGSRVNADNVYDVGIDTYAKSRSLEPVDTIRNSGRQANGNYWLEYILGGYVVGYSNVTERRKGEFDKAVSYVKRSNK